MSIILTINFPEMFIDGNKKFSNRFIMASDSNLLQNIYRNFIDE